MCWSYTKRTSSSYQMHTVLPMIYLNICSFSIEQQSHTIILKSVLKVTQIINSCPFPELFLGKERISRFFRLPQIRRKKPLFNNSAIDFDPEFDYAVHLLILTFILQYILILTLILQYICLS